MTNTAHSSAGLAICSIVAKNYLAQARVLARSFRRHHPDGQVFVLVIDDDDGYVDPSHEPFDVVRLRELPIENLPEMCFMYSVLELSTAAKPFLLSYLLDLHRPGRLLYLDPDVLVTDSLLPIYELLTRHSIAITPHVFVPIEDGRIPNEVTFLRAGAYNLGFLGVSDTSTTRAMLGWWQRRCKDRCLAQPRVGLFVDQKWFDLVPSLFEDVVTIREPGCNAAYWNLQERSVTLQPSPRVNGQPLRFFHFSGFSPDRPDFISKHQTRFTMDDVGEARTLFDAYAAELRREGWFETMRWPYGFDRFDNGVRIAPALRLIYYHLGSGRRGFGNPFTTTGSGSFYSWLGAPASFQTGSPPYVSNLVQELWGRREEVGDTLPRFGADQREVFIDWLRTVGWTTLKLDPRLLAPVGGPRGRLHQAWRTVARATSPSSCRACLMLEVLDRHDLRARARLLTEQFVRVERRAGNGSPSLGGPVPVDNPARLRVPSVLLGHAVKALLNPCPRHLGLQVLTAADPATTQVGPQIPGRQASMGRVESRGLNIVGYFSTESGVGEAARLMAHSVEAARIPHVLVNVEQSHGLRRQDRTFTRFSKSNPHGINLLHINADQCPQIIGSLGPEFGSGRYNIGYWFWELSRFPPTMAGAFAHFHEIWTASSFVADAIARVAPCPIVRVPLPLTQKTATLRERRTFELPADRFIFLFVFDFRSIFERKNPLSVVEAFRRAFGATERAMLVLKCNNADSDPDNAARLRAACADPRIRLLEGYFDRQDVTSLIHACDAFVSLHRSEGLGLTMAEAMQAAKPVIATAYSGNLDFMTPNNSLLVRYRLVELDQDAGPYRSGAVWADPDVEHAAELMRWVVEHREAATALGLRGKQDLQRWWSAAAAGQAVKERLSLIWQRLHG